MSLSPSDVKKIAHLARLAIPDNEIEPLTQDLTKIISFVEQMNEEDTRSVSPLAHPLDVNQPLRTDQISETNQRELFQQIAPNTKAGLYIVPQVIETE